jgi:hypothetical protein
MSSTLRKMEKYAKALVHFCVSVAGDDSVVFVKDTQNAVFYLWNEFNEAGFKYHGLKYWIKEGDDKTDFDIPLPDLKYEPSDAKKVITASKDTKSDQTFKKEWVVRKASSFLYFLRS